MKVFQILKGQVLILDGDKQYADTVDNFKTDASLSSTSGLVIYDDQQECCVVNGNFLAYPNALYQSYIDRIADLIVAKAKREYCAHKLVDGKCVNPDCIAYVKLETTTSTTTTTTTESESK